MMGTVQWGSGCPPARSILGIVTNRHPAAGRRQGTPKHLAEVDKSLAGLCKRVWLCWRALGKRDGEGAERHHLLQEQGLSLRPPDRS